MNLGTTCTTRKYELYDGSGHAPYGHQATGGDGNGANTLQQPLFHSDVLPTKNSPRRRVEEGRTSTHSVAVAVEPHQRE